MSTLDERAKLIAARCRTVGSHEAHDVICDLLGALRQVQDIKDKAIMALADYDTGDQPVESWPSFDALRIVLGGECIATTDAMKALKGELKAANERVGEGGG